jgi:GNAT superfamily N-acetyltransferase
MIGTMTLESTDRGSEIPSYREAATASLHQLAVDPARQGAGVGRALIAYAVAWARARRYDRLALDTPESALRQVAWYLDRGFDILERVRVPGRRYASVVLGRQLAARGDRHHGFLGALSGMPAPRHSS